MKENKNWSFIQLEHDKYQGWICNKQFTYINKDEYIQDVINNVLTHINESSINLIKDILKEDFSLKIQNLLILITTSLSFIQVMILFTII